MKPSKPPPVVELDSSALEDILDSPDETPTVPNAVEAVRHRPPVRWWMIALMIAIPTVALVVVSALS